MISTPTNLDCEFLIEIQFYVQLSEIIWRNCHWATNILTKATSVLDILVFKCIRLYPEAPTSCSENWKLFMSVLKLKQLKLAFKEDGDR